MLCLFYHKHGLNQYNRDMEDKVLKRLQDLTRELEDLIQERELMVQELKMKDARIRELSVIIPELNRLRE